MTTALVDPVANPASGPDWTTWTPVRGGDPRPALRVFCLPHAGGSASAFRGWTVDVPAGVEVCVVQPPGRETRFGEPFPAGIVELAAPLSRALLPLLDVPFALVGNSMGALVAFEVARYLQQRYLLSPVRLFAASAFPPGGLPPGPDPATLSDAAFVDLLQRTYGGFPAELLDQPDYLELYLPVLRADMAILHAYRPAARPSLRCPVTALVGSDDHSLTPATAAGWGERTTAAFDRAGFAGGHFGLISQRDLVLDRLAVF